MTDTAFRCIIIALFFAAFGLLGLLHSENVRLVRARRRTAAVMRRLKRDRDAAVESLKAAADCARDEVARADELDRELAVYRREERERFGAGANARLN